MEAGKYLVEQFVVQGLVAAVALPLTVMSAANLIDTWWAVCLDRAEKAGKLLAHVLMSGAHGDRYNQHSVQLLTTWSFIIVFKVRESQASWPGLWRHMYSRSQKGPQSSMKDCLACWSVGAHP